MWDMPKKSFFDSYHYKISNIYDYNQAENMYYAIIAGVPFLDKQLKSILDNYLSPEQVSLVLNEALKAYSSSHFLKLLYAFSQNQGGITKEMLLEYAFKNGLSALDVELFARSICR